MNTSWLSLFPEKKTTIDLIDFKKRFHVELFPTMRLGQCDYHQLAYYDLVYHDVVFNSARIKDLVIEKFINTFFHEIGHSTGQATNRHNRINENICGSKERYGAEEVIAECLSVIFYLATFEENYCPYVNNSIKYIYKYKTKQPIAWQEIELAILKIVKDNYMDIYLEKSKMLKNFLLKNNIISIENKLYTN